MTANRAMETIKKFRDKKVNTLVRNVAVASGSKQAHTTAIKTDRKPRAAFKNNREKGEVLGSQETLQFHDVPLIREGAPQRRERIDKTIRRKPARLTAAKQYLHALSWPIV